MCQVIFFPHNMLGNIELNVNTTNNRVTLVSYFTSQSFEKNSPF